MTRLLRPGMPWPEAAMLLPAAALIVRPCWELVRIVYRERLGIDLPAHGDVDHRDLARCAAAFGAGQASGTWLPVTVGAEREFDLLLIDRPHGGKLLPTHVGIVTRPGFVLHAEEARGVQLMAFRDGADWRADPEMRPFARSLWRHSAFGGRT